jgi:hypothetical protein
MKTPKIESSDRCSHCGCWSGDCDQPFRIYSEARAKWLEEAVKQLMQIEGDDDWVDWINEGKELTKRGE